jgi:hypothetical protein
VNSTGVLIISCPCDKDDLIAKGRLEDDLNAEGRLAELSDEMEEPDF